MASAAINVGKTILFHQLFALAKLQVTELLYTRLFLVSPLQERIIKQTKCKCIYET